MKQTARIAGFTLTLLGFVAAASAGEPLRLNGLQLDGVNAGKTRLGAMANGTGDAQGTQAAVTVNTSAIVAPGTPNPVLTTGQVMSTASSLASGGPATANSTLSVSVTLP